MIEKNLDTDSTIELYNNGKSKYNESKFEEAADSFLKAAINFEKLGEVAWAARTYGRVAWSKIDIGDFETGDSFLEVSKNLDFNQATLNYIWSIYRSSKKNRIQIARKYLQDSISMIYHEKNYSYINLTMHLKTLDRNPDQLIWQLFHDFYAYNIKKEKKTHLSWSISDEGRRKSFLSHLTSMKENNIVESLKEADLLLMVDECTPEENEKIASKIKKTVEAKEVISQIRRSISFTREGKKIANIKYSIISIFFCILIYYIIFDLFGIEFITTFTPIIGIIAFNIKIWGISYN